MAKHQTRSIDAIIIDASNRTVTQRPVADELESWQHIVGGHIECCIHAENGDEFYANENGRRERTLHYWTLRGHPMLLVGDAFVVGTRANSGKFYPPKMPLAEVQAQVQFLDEAAARVKYAEMQAWRKDSIEQQVVKMAKQRGVSVDEVRKSVVLVDGVFPGDEE